VLYARVVTAADPGQAVLDTSVVRALGDARRPFHLDVRDGLRALRGHGFTIHLADGTMTELTSQLSDRRIPWPEWVRARSTLTTLLDHSEPALLGGWEILAEAGIFTDGRGPLTSRQEIRAGWKRMEKARSYAEIWKVRPFRMEGKIVLGGTKRDSPRAVVDTEKGSWIEGLDHIAGVAQVEGIQDVKANDWEDLVAVIGRGLDARVGSAIEPPPSVRLDALIRVYARYSRQRIQSVGPYNPEKRSNDAFDHDLPRYLALPALVCTCDDATLVRSVEDAETWQRRWILGVKEFRDISRGTPAPVLAWPVKTSPP
jgi:hypothetical protein